MIPFSAGYLGMREAVNVSEGGGEVPPRLRAKRTLGSPCSFTAININ